MSGIHILGGGTLPVESHPEEKIRFTTKGGGWGDNVSIMDWPKKDDEDLASVVGHKNPPPRVGDELVVPLKSGKKMLCEFVSVNLCGDPADMFFGDIKVLEYL